MAAETEPEQGPVRAEVGILGDMLSSLGGWAWQTDADLNLTGVAGAADHILRFATRHALGQPVLDMLVPYLSDSDLAVFRSRFIAREPLTGFEYHRTGSPGRELRLRTTAWPDFGPDGRFQGYIAVTMNVTREHEALGNVAQAESLLVEAMEAIGDGFAIYDADDRLVLFNARYRSIYGNLVRIGIRKEQLVASAERRGIYRNMDAGLPRRFAKRDRSSDPTEVELADGRWFAMKSAAFKEGWRAVIATDITEIIKRETSLRESRSRLEAIMSSVAEGILLLDVRGRVVESNSAAAEMFRYPESEVPGLAATDLLAPGRGGADIAAQFVGGEFTDATATPCVVSALRKDGTTFPVEISFRPLDVAGSRDVVMVVRDVSQREEMNEQLAHADRLTSLGETAAKLAHEINQPLAVINMSAENALLELEQAEGDPDYVESRLHMIADQVSRLRELIEHIGSFARRHEPGDELFGVGEALESAVKLFASELAKDDIALDLSLPEAPIFTTGKAIHLQQVFVNLIANARDAIIHRAQPDAGRRICIVAEKTDGVVTIAVSDTGGGIPDDIRASVFEPFFTTKAAGKGTGLGLSVVERIVSGMRGHINVENTGDGCCFTVSLPTSTDAA